MKGPIVRVSVCIAFAAVLLPAAPIGAEEPVTSRRLAGVDRYATAVAIANATFPASAEGESNASDVALARGDVFADALAAVTAVPQGGAVLLTPHDRLPSAVGRFLQERNSGRTFLMGQEDAVSRSVEHEVKERYYPGRHHLVVRLAGRDRYETAALAHRHGADFFGGGQELDGLRTAILVNGLSSADAVSAGPLAYEEALPLLLTAPDQLPRATRDALLLDDDQHDPIEQVVIVGGPDVVSEQVVQQLRQIGMTVRRVAGPNRQVTAIRVWEFAEQELGWILGHVNLARGDAPVDALAGGPHAGREKAPILLTVSRDELGEVNREFLRSRPRRQDLDRSNNDSSVIDVFGDASAVSDAVVRDAEMAAAQSPPPPG